MAAPVHRRAIPALAVVAAAALAGAAPASISAQRSISGTVVDAGGTPIADALVFPDSDIDSAIRTALDGTFELSAGVTVGQISVRATGFSPGASRLFGDGDVTLDPVVLETGPVPLATLSGRVTNGVGGAALEGVVVRLNDDQAAISDVAGVFDFAIAPVEWGENRLEVDHLSFGQRTEVLWITDADETHFVAMPLEPAPVELSGVVVERSLAPSVPDLMAGFNERRESTGGYFLTEAEIEDRNPIGLRSVLRTVPGMRVRESLEGTEILFTRQTPSVLGFSSGDAQTTPNACRSPLIYVDNVLVARDTERHVEIDHLVDMSIVTGMEAYNGASRIPTMFSNLGSGCGVVAIWTEGTHTGRTLNAEPNRPDEQLLQVGSSKKKYIIAGILIPAIAYGFYTAVCSLPHYCR